MRGQIKTDARGRPRWGIGEEPVLSRRRRTDVRSGSSSSSCRRVGSRPARVSGSKGELTWLWGRVDEAGTGWNVLVAGGRQLGRLRLEKRVPLRVQGGRTSMH